MAGEKWRQPIQIGGAADGVGISSSRLRLPVVCCLHACAAIRWKPANTQSSPSSASRSRLSLAKASGLDPTRVLESITTGAAGSWPLANLMPRALRGDFEPGFSVTHLLKDLAIALRCAERLGLELPGLTLARRLYDELAQQGLGSKGTQVLLRRYLERGTS